MGPLWISLLLCAVSVMAESNSEPMVAFVCNRPAMFLRKDGWVKDDSSDCLTDPAHILNYCKKVYPGLDVRNVVESSKKVTIDKWCGFGHNRCHKKYTVRAFRCLVGPFQSDALLVPEHCLFDHIHQPTQCRSYMAWNTTATTSCDDRGMALQSFAILQPCGTDRFNGVEFVCCPEEDDVDTFLRNEFTVFSTEPVTSPSTSTTSTTSTTTTTTTSTSEAPPPPEDDVLSSPNDIYNQYLHNVRGKYVNEHEYFMKAKNDLQKHHHEKVTRMMKEWAEARQRVQDVKSVDPKGAEKLNREITARFQRTYEALEQEGLAEKKQLIALHQQRIQALLNEKKRHAMEHYMEVLTDDTADASRILKALRHYVKIEQKDRLHSLNHFKHLRDTDASEAAAVRQQTMDHLSIIDKRVQQAVQMLDRQPKYRTKVHTQIAKYIETFHPIDESISSLLLVPADPPRDNHSKQQDVSKGRLLDVPQVAYTHVIKVDVVAETERASTAAPETERPSVPTLHRVAISKMEPDTEVRGSKYDDEVVENEHDFVEVHPDAHVAHVQESGLGVQQGFIDREPLSAVQASGTPLAIAVGSITVFIMIVVGVVVLRKRSLRAPATHGFVEVDQTASPEERHVANMQMNGYENPTYRYFEMNGNA